MQLLYYVFLLIQLLIGINLVFPLALYLIYLIRKSVTTPPSPASPNEKTAEADYAIIVTAYQQTDQLPAVVESLLQLNYCNYQIYIVADNCDITTIPIRHPRVTVLRPEQVLSSNTKSHFYAIHRFIREHDRLIIIDSDNTVDPGVLSELNAYFDRGYEAVQGLREAANLDTELARLDAARDIYYHFYDGKVLFGAGSSATLAGSGMAFSVALYRACLEHLTIEGAGFDKVLQSQILSRKYRIAFAPRAIVYDEKTTESQQLVGQRARWINTWFRYFSYGFTILGNGLASGNWNQLLFGMVLLRPPLFIFLALSVLFCVVNLLISPAIALAWGVGLLLFVVGFGLALVQSPTDRRIYTSLYKIPSFVFYQLLALTKVRKANKLSVATRHGSSTTSPTVKP